MGRTKLFGRARAGTDFTLGLDDLLISRPADDRRDRGPFLRPHLAQQIIMCLRWCGARLGRTAAPLPRNVGPRSCKWAYSNLTYTEYLSRPTLFRSSSAASPSFCSMVSIHFRRLAEAHWRSLSPGRKAGSSAVLLSLPRSFGGDATARLAGSHPAHRVRLVLEMGS